MKAGKVKSAMTRRLYILSLIYDVLRCITGQAAAQPPPFSGSATAVHYPGARKHEWME